MDQQKIGRFLAQLRHEQHLTQEQAAEKLGVSSKSISRWENGVNMPDISLLPELASLYGVTVNELVAGERIAPQELPQKTDEVLLAAMTEQLFSNHEKSRFYKKKWLRDEGWQWIAGCVIGLIALAAALVSLQPRLAGLTAVAAYVAYMVVHNRMMSYVEHKFYDKD